MINQSNRLTLRKSDLKLSTQLKKLLILTLIHSLATNAVRPAAAAELYPEPSTDLESSTLESPAPSHRNPTSPASGYYCPSGKGVSLFIVAIGLIGGIVLLLWQPWNNQNQAPGGSTEIPPFDPPSGVPFQRGMYLSIWSNLIRNNNTNKYNLILDDANKMNEVINFISKERIDSLSLYNIPAILDTNGMPQKLADFITMAKKNGIQEVFAAGSKNIDFDAMAYFQSKYPSRFDGIITEVEFWNAKNDQRTQAFNDFLALTKYIKSRNIQAWGKPVKLAIYLGLLNSVPNQTELQIAQQLSTVSDRILVHCYSQTPEESYLNCQQRFRILSQTGTGAELVPLMNAESQEFSTSGGPTGFLGDYLTKHRNLSELETSVKELFHNDFNTPNIRGFYYFEYPYLDYAINSEIHSQQ